MHTLRRRRMQYTPSMLRAPTRARDYHAASVDGSSYPPDHAPRVRLAPITLVLIFKVVGDEGPFQAVTVPDLEERTRQVCSRFTDLQLKDASIDLAACGSDAACTSALVARAGVDEALLVVVNFSASPAIATLQLLGANRKQAIETDLLEIKSAGVEVAGEIGASVEKLLLRAGHQRGAQLAAGSTDAIAAPAETGILESPWFWGGAIGAVVAAAAITAVLIARPNAEHPICLQVGRSDSCYE